MLPRLTCSALHNKISTKANHKSAHGETVRETANMISFCADAIGIRDDMYLGAGNAYMREVGAALDDG
ncbi:putative aspartate/ornithine carbamoyltransferase [Escherichia coli]|uniref:Putative aspartate/ornithine carbamoyltransferase n=1 Tax=Escherichia coli TaxID=562 RepID=A0A377CXF2_ECOLX|nr:putative aspartate/ornithine carbamoyltransferase [Escherichia coli]